MARTRRGLLALLAASTGCLGFGGGDQVTPQTVETSPGPASESATASPTAPPTDSPANTTTGTQTGTATRTETASPTPTQTDTESPTETVSPTPTATETDTPSPTPTASPTPTPTPTPRAAQAPPEGSLSLGEVTIEVEPDRRGAEATVTVSLSSSGEVTFTVIELRVDLYYESLFRSRRKVGTGYIVAEDEGGVGGTVAGVVDIDDGRLDGTEPEGRFSVELRYRRVRYEKAA